MDTSDRQASLNGPKLTTLQKSNILSIKQVSIDPLESEESINSLKPTPCNGSKICQFFVFILVQQYRTQVDFAFHVFGSQLEVFNTLISHIDYEYMDTIYIDIDMTILENVDINIDIDRDILENIDSKKDILGDLRKY